jgi:hypothetical protein
MMRWIFATTLLLGVSACSVDNPVFGLLTEASTTGTGAATTGVDPPATTTRPEPTTGPGESTAIAETTAGVDETGESTTTTTTTTTTDMTTQLAAPDTGETTLMDPDTGSTGQPPVCEITKAEDMPFRMVTRMDGQDIECDQGDTTLRGPIALMGDALAMTDVGFCPAPYKQIEYTLGTGWSAVYAGTTITECAHVTIRWDNSDGKCRIGTIVVQNIAGDAELLLIALFFPISTDLNNTPLKPQPAGDMTCDCPADMQECCGGTKPGDRELAYDNQSAAPGGTIMVQVNGEMMSFHNWQAFVDPVCIEDPSMSALHADWVAYK